MITKVGEFSEEVMGKYKAFLEQVKSLQLDIEGINYDDMEGVARFVQRNQKNIKQFFSSNKENSDGILAAISAVDREAGADAAINAIEKNLPALSLEELKEIKEKMDFLYEALVNNTDYFRELKLEEALGFGGFCQKLGFVAAEAAEATEATLADEEKKLAQQAQTPEEKAGLEKIAGIIDATKSSGEDEKLSAEKQVINRVALAAGKLAIARIAYKGKEEENAARLVGLEKNYEKELKVGKKIIKSPGVLTVLNELVDSIKEVGIRKARSPSWNKYRSTKKQIKELKKGAVVDLPSPRVGA